MRLSFALTLTSQAVPTIYLELRISEKEGFCRGRFSKTPFFKNGALLNLPRQNSFFSLVVSSKYIVGTAWLVKVGANESRIYPSYLTGV